MTRFHFFRRLFENARNWACWPNPQLCCTPDPTRGPEWSRSTWTTLTRGADREGIPSSWYTWSSAQSEQICEFRALKIECVIESTVISKILLIYPRYSAIKKKCHREYEVASQFTQSRNIKDERKAVKIIQKLAMQVKESFSCSRYADINVFPSLPL